MTPPKEPDHKHTNDGDKSNFSERPRRDIDAGRDDVHKVTPSHPWPEPAQRKPEPQRDK